MTNTIPLSELGAAAGDDGLRRDQWGRLLVVPPEGGKPQGYTRCTTVAKATDDGGGLMPWKATMTACGLMMRPGLRAKWEALVSAHDGRPWYAGEQPKAACKRLVEECAEAGGAGDRREQGIALHAITAQLDRGSPPAHLSPETERDLEVYVNTLIEHGVNLHQEWVERTVVNDTHRVGGSFDRLASVRGYRLPMIADLKTGEDISYSSGAFAVQLAGYAYAEAMYTQGADPNGSADVRASMPEVDRRHGLVIHLPAGGARCDLYIVDLEAGWEGFRLALDVRAWRTRKGLSLPIAAAPSDSLEPTLAASLATDNYADQQIEADNALAAERERLGLRTAEPFITGHEEAAVAAVSREELRAWLQARIDACGAYSDASRTDLLRSWPPAVPGLKHAGHNDEQLAAIEAVLDAVETRNSVPFGPTRPGTAMTSTAVLDRLTRAFPNSTLTTKENLP